MKTLAIVSPCYNEEKILEKSLKKLHSKLKEFIEKKLVKSDSFILIVDDGSKDNSWEIIKKLTGKNIKGIKLSRNVGHQNAIWAGMEFVKDKCDFCITIDIDLQDDLDVIEKMIEEYYKGNDIVFGVKKERKADSFIKRKSAEFFYKIMNLLGVDLIYNHADFRLLSSKALNFLLSFEERNLFIRGLVRLIGLKSTCVYYNIKEREKGKSKYTLLKIISFAWEGLTSFSTFPLKIVMATGFIICIFSFIMGLYALYFAIFTNRTVPGWASIIIAIYFLGGIQLFSIGIIGEYVGKIYKEVKKRPRYFIEEELW